MTYGPVAIFWDYENCSPQHGAGFTVVDNIRQVAHQYGSVKFFKAYLELAEQNSAKSLQLRSELQSCGVSLTDCPHNGRKDVADKMMIVDMLTYAIDTPAPATIILISGDRDFVYAVSVLRLRQYHVVVVAPMTAHSSLRSRASVVHDWDCEILRRPVSQAPHVTFDASAGRVWSELDNGAQKAGHQSVPSLVGSSKSNRRHSFRESGSYSPFVCSPTKPVRQEGIPETTQGPLRPHPTVSLSFPGISAHNRDGGLTASADKPDVPHVESTQGSLSAPWKGLSPSPLDNNLLSPISPANPNRLTPSGGSSDSTNAAHFTAPSTVVTGAARAGTVSGDNNVPIIDPIGVATEAVPKRNENAIQTSRCNQPSPVTAELLPLGPSSPYMPPGSLQSETTSPTRVALTATSPNRGQRIFPPCTPERLEPLARGSDADVVEGTQPFRNSHDASINKFPPISITAPAGFEPMIDILQQARDQGQPRILRSALALQLTQRNRTVYQEAGFNKFRDYAARAHSIGLVELGGCDGADWISLTSS